MRKSPRRFGESSLRRFDKTCSMVNEARLMLVRISTTSKPPVAGQQRI